MSEQNKPREASVKVKRTYWLTYESKEVATGYTVIVNNHLTVREYNRCVRMLNGKIRQQGAR